MTEVTDSKGKPIRTLDGLLHYVEEVFGAELFGSPEAAAVRKDYLKQLLRTDLWSDPNTRKLPRYDLREKHHAVQQEPIVVIDQLVPLLPDHEFKDAFDVIMWFASPACPLTKWVYYCWPPGRKHPFVTEPIPLKGQLIDPESKKPVKDWLKHTHFGFAKEPIFDTYKEQLEVDDAPSDP